MASSTPELPRRESGRFSATRTVSTGRPAGAVFGAGLGSLFFWIDRKSGIGGRWGSQILPLQDAVSYPGSVDFEAAVYRDAL